MSPPFEWQTASPESRGLSGARLEAMKDGLAARGTKALLVIRGDRIVHEWYAPDHGPEKRHYSASRLAWIPLSRSSRRYWSS